MGLLGKTAKAGSGLLDELIKSYNALQSAGEKVPDSLLDAMSKEYDKVKPKTHLDSVLAQGEKADLPSDVLSQGYKPDVFHHVGSPNIEAYDFGADRVSGGTTPAGLYTHNRMRDSKVYEGIATENNRPWERYSVVSSTDKPFVVGETKPNDELRNNFIKQMELKFGDKYSELPDHKRGYYDEKIEKFMQHGNTSSSPLTPMQQRQVYLDSGYDSLLLNGNEMVFLDTGKVRDLRADFNKADVGKEGLFKSAPTATAGAGILGLGAAAQSNDTYADFSPSNLARLKSSDVGSIEAPQSMAASNIAGLMGSVNKVGYDDPLLGMVASQLPSELMNKIAYNDRRGLLDYAKAYAGLLGF